MTTPESLIEQAKYQARLYGLDGSLVCAVIEQESNWNTWAIRYEPAFQVKYVNPIPNISDTERIARSTSWGLMQTMGQIAREEGFSHPYLSMLCDPDISLAIGCKKLAKCMEAAGHVEAEALLKWNGGGNAEYPLQVIARKDKYQ